MAKKMSQVKFPDEGGLLHRQIKAHAASQGVRLGDWVADTLADAAFFERNRAKHAKQAKGDKA